MALIYVVWGKFSKESYLAGLATVSACAKHPNDQILLTASRPKRDLLLTPDVGLFRAGLHSSANLLMYVWG